MLLLIGSKWSGYDWWIMDGADEPITLIHR